MLLAIDVGNTDTKVGFSRDNSFIAVWRRPTSAPDSFADWLRDCAVKSQISFELEGAACASVVPEHNERVREGVDQSFGCDTFFIGSPSAIDLAVEYESAIGADRIANVLGALAHYKPALIVVDFGSATTFDVVDNRGAFIGGAIMPGIDLSLRSLASKTSLLPLMRPEVPSHAIGRSTGEGIQAGCVLAAAGAVDFLVSRMNSELGTPATVLATGGLSSLMVGTSREIQHFLPQLTLYGIVSALNRHRAARRAD
jgi:type III pantothenate kinase